MYTSAAVNASSTEYQSTMPSSSPAAQSSSSTRYWHAQATKTYLLFSSKQVSSLSSTVMAASGVASNRTSSSASRRNTSDKVKMKWKVGYSIFSLSGQIVTAQTAWSSNDYPQPWLRWNRVIIRVTLPAVVKSTKKQVISRLIYAGILVSFHPGKVSSLLFWTQNIKKWP